MLEYKELRKLLKNKNYTGDIHSDALRCALLGDTSTQFLSTALRGAAIERDINIVLFEGDYNQIDLLLMDKQSEYYKFKSLFTILFMSSQRLYEKFMQTDMQERECFAENEYKRIMVYWDCIRSQSNQKIIFFLFCEKDDGVVGNFSAKYSLSFFFQIKKLNMMLMEAASSQSNVFLFDLNKAYFHYGERKVFDRRLYITTKSVISFEVLPYIAYEILKIISVNMGVNLKKCVILDLDNTLWGGIISEDGLEGIELGELGIGQVFTEFQIWLKELKRRGIILCVCSKNDENVAKAPFINHDDMILKLDDISVFVANWENKSQNIRMIRDLLNIGYESIVYIDDSPFERNEVRNRIGNGICIPEMPSDPTEYVSFLQACNFFETASVSVEDSDRTKQYQAESMRQEIAAKFESYDEYLDSLDINAILKPFNNFDVPRIAQLTQRSNQFNLCTGRYNEEDIQRIMGDKNYIAFTISLCDCLGDYGLISIIILKLTNSDLCEIKEWIMSCRVLRRGVEDFAMNTIIEKAKNAGCKQVVGHYIPTKKNAMVKDLLSGYGFSYVNDKYIIDVEEYKAKGHHIKVKKDEL